MNMNNESRIGFVYKISGYGLDYFGSTIQPLCERKSTHKTTKNCSSYEIIKQGDDWVLECVETILTDTKKTGLKEREQFWIENNECVNKNQAIQSAEDLREYKRKFAEDTRRAKGIAKKEKVKTANEKEYKKIKTREYRANYTEDKREEVLAKKREAYDNETQKEYVNRPEIKERRLAEQTRKRALIKAFSVLPFAEV
jgi:hypothetical protein